MFPVSLGSGDSALNADSKNKTDYQTSIVSFQAIYMNTGTWPTTSNENQTSTLILPQFVVQSGQTVVL